MKEKITEDRKLIAERASYQRSEAMRRRHADPNYAEKHAERARVNFIELSQRPEFKKARDEAQRKLHADLKYAKFNAERAREQMRNRIAIDPNCMAALQAGANKLREDPNFRKRRADHMHRLHANPEFAKARDRQAAENFRKLKKKLAEDPAFAKQYSEALSAGQRRRWEKWRKERGTPTQK